ncbi:MAG: MFS transporter [Planctomycetota bacterium]
MTKISILLSSVLIQTCIGGLYAWSEFVPALTDTHGLSTAQTQLIFGALIAAFTVSMVVAGRLLNRIAPRWIAMFGGLLFGGGYWIAARSGGDFGLLLLGIGIVTGIGTGFCYVCPLTMCAKWFPERKGLVTGIAVAGFGGGAVVLSALGEHWFAHDIGILPIFGRIGVLYGAAIVLAALPLRMPGGERAGRPPVAFGILTRDRHFWGLALGMFAGTFAGLLVIGNLKPMLLAAGASSTVATAAISAFAIGNAIGRVSWGGVADRVGAGVVPVSLSFLTATLLLAWVLPGASAGAIALSALLGIGFGACFVVYAAETASHYGADRLAAIYPLVFLAYGLSGLAGPWVGGLVYDRTGSYAGGLLLSFAVLAVAIVGTVVLLGLFRREVGFLEKGVQHE